MKPSDEINNGSANTGGDDGEGVASGWRRPWRTSAWPQKCNFRGGMTVAQAPPSSESRGGNNDNDIP